MFDAIATLLVFDLAGLDPASPTGAALHFFVMDVAKILVLLTTVIYLMGWLLALLKPERVRAIMKGRSGPGARLMAVIALSLQEMLILRKVAQWPLLASSPLILPPRSCWSASCSTV